MKIRYIFCLMLLVPSQCTSRQMPEKLPFGKWDYDLRINGVSVGDAVITNKETTSHYISETEMKMIMGKITNTSHQVVTETKDFKPVKLEINNSIIVGDTKQNIITRATFRGKDIEFESQGNRSRLKFHSPFVIDGNFFMNKLIENRFKKGYKITSLIYEPSIEPEEPINVSVEVIGFENFTTGKGSRDLLHVVQSIENFKSVDIYLNGKGIMEIAVIKMLNNRIELIRK